MGGAPPSGGKTASRGREFSPSRESPAILPSTGETAEVLWERPVGAAAAWSVSRTDSPPSTGAFSKSELAAEW